MAHRNVVVVAIEQFFARSPNVAAVRFKQELSQINR